MAYQERVYREEPVVVERASAAPAYADHSGWTSYAFVKYAFILAITIVILYFVAKYILPMIGGES